MTQERLVNEYFEWMYQLVCDRNQPYRKLLYRLHDIEFTYIIDMDGNRFEDGINLRYRFGYERGYPNAMIATYLDDSPCSVLEMIISLGIQCEEQIMDDPTMGVRTSQWIWGMLENLGLKSSTDDNFDRDYVDEVIDIFLNREYERDGRGGLFTIENCDRDLRSVEIWYQMCWYLDHILNI